MLKKYLRVSFVFLIFISIFFLSSQNLFAQEEETVEVQPKVEEINDIQKLFNESEKYEDERKNLEIELKEQTEITSLEKTYNSSREYINQCSQKFKDKRLSKNTDIDSMRTLKSEIAIYSEICSNLKEQVVKKLNKIGTLHNDWTSRKEYWAGLKNQSSFINNKNAEEVFDTGDKTIEAALALFDGADIPISELNQRINELDKDINKLIEDTEKFIKELQSRLFKKSHNAMLSSKYFDELKELFNNKAEKKDEKQSFNEIYDSYGWVFILQLIVFIVLGLYLKNVQDNFLAGFNLNFLHKNYISSSIIFSVLFGIPFLLDNFPSLVKLAYTILICIAAGIIICGKISNKSLKACVTLVFILYILYKIFDLADIPSALSRLILAIVSLIAGVYFLK